MIGCENALSKSPMDSRVLVANGIGADLDRLKGLGRGALILLEHALDLGAIDSPLRTILHERATHGAVVAREIPLGAPAVGT